MQIQGGLWGSDMSKSSSNHREYQNLVKSGEDYMIEVQLTNADLFIKPTTMPLRASTI